MEVSSELIRDFGGLPGLVRASFREFLEVGGLGKAKAATLAAH